MPEYLITQTRQLILTAESAAEARTIAENTFYVRPGFNRELFKSIRETNLLVEKRRD